MEDHKEQTQLHMDGGLPADRIVSSVEHILCCRECQDSINSWAAAKRHFARIKQAELPPFFESKLNAKLKTLREPVFDLRSYLVPAAAFTALALMLWGTLALWESEPGYPLDEVIAEGNGPMTAALIRRPENEPAAFLGLIDKEAL